ncbi:tRNA N(3)-cytidine methyltransferase METTL8, mitochondrial isoform 1-T1 [Fundulus diaphanus]
MHKQWSISVLKRASAFIRFYVRLKSTNARPAAPLGSRILTNPEDVFKHNMWDHVQWTEEDQEAARQKAEENSSIRLPLTEQDKFDTDASQYWDQFYEVHQDKFFKDRRWLFLEFPELLPSSAEKRRTNACLSHQVAADSVSGSSHTDGETGHCRHNDPIQHRRKTDTFFPQEAAPEPNETVTRTSFFPGEHASFRILEVGCGVGNSVFPIVNTIKNTDSFLYCCDFSPRAIQLVKDHPDYDEAVCHAFVHDICVEAASFPFLPQSLDVILAVFVLSSIHPQRMQRVVNQLSTYLKHGGVFLFRDYGRYDFSQLRFKKGRCISDNFYTRGDGTCVYFFTKEEVHDLFSKAGLEEIQNLEDKRLQVNRGKKVVMRRVWMQSKYRKPS